MGIYQQEGQVRLESHEVVMKKHTGRYVKFQRGETDVSYWIKGVKV